MRNHIIGDVPPFNCLVRREFLRDFRDGYGEFERAIAIGGVLRKDMALCVTVLLECGALWYELPLHAICWKECEPKELKFHQRWDCLSGEWTAHRYEHLRHLAVEVVPYAADPGAGTLPGSYMFTIDMSGSFYADHPAEHKTLNIIALDSGHIVAMPNNKVLFRDETFTSLAMPDYVRNSRHYFCEEPEHGDGPCPFNGAHRVMAKRVKVGAALAAAVLAQAEDMPAAISFPSELDIDLAGEDSDLKGADMEAIKILCDTWVNAPYLEGLCIRRGLKISEEESGAMGFRVMLTDKESKHRRFRGLASNRESALWKALARFLLQKRWDERKAEAEARMPTDPGI